jgi:cysteine desulfurase / selenocysteine lyase
MALRRSILLLLLPLFTNVKEFALGWSQLSSCKQRYGIRRRQSTCLNAINHNNTSVATSTTTQEELATCNDLPHAYISERTRKDFPLINERSLGEDGEIPLIYLDSAATSQKPQAVLNAINEYYRSSNANVHRGAHTLSKEATEAYEQSRDKVQQFIGARSRNEIVFTSGATDAINIVAYSYGRAFLQEGDEILLTVAEHHSNLVPWQMVAAEKGLVLKFVNLLDGGLDVEHLTSLLSDRTRILSFQHVSNVLGCINPVKEIVQLVRATSPQCRIVLDACQSIPHMPVNVMDLDIDFLAASGHKMCAPTGIGFLYGREELLNEMPPFMGGGEMIEEVFLTSSTFQKSPGRFEAGTPGTIYFQILAIYSFAVLV